MKYLQLYKSTALICLSALMINQADAANFPANPEQKQGYSLIFQEEFNSSTLDSNKWLDYYLPHWANSTTLPHAKAQYTIANGVMTQSLAQSTQNWSPYDGTVKVSSIQTYNKPGLHRFNKNQSTVVQQHPNNLNNFNGFTFQYGYMEIRAKFSNVGGGGHQAWWLIGTESDDTDNDGRNTTQNGEVDIIETFFSHGDKWQAVIHQNNDPNLSYYFNNLYQLPADVRNEFHVYAMDWTPSGMKFYFDNQLVFQAPASSAPAYEMAMILGIYTDAGSGQHNNVWPKSWQVDYVRVWQDDNGYQTPVTQYYRIKDRWKQSYLVAADSSSNVTYSLSTNTNMTDQWEKVSVDNGYFILRNRATGKEMNIENLNGRVSNSDVPNTYWSAHWKEVPYQNYVRLENRFKPTQEINVEGQLGYAQSSDVPITYWSSQWTFEPVIE